MAQNFQPLRHPLQNKATAPAVPALLAVLALAMVLSTPALAQSRPFGTEPEQGDIRTMLGECPVEALRAGWAEMEALEAVAVEAEVLGLCTERAETINRVIANQIQLEAAVAGLRAETSPTATLATPDTPTPEPALTPEITALRAEIETLRQRIDDLEGHPDDAATLIPLRAALARKEEELARAEATEAANARPDAAPDPVPGAEPPAPETGVTPPSTPVQTLRPGNARTDTDTPAPAHVELQSAPPEPDAGPWQFVWAARQGEDGPWKAGFVRIVRTWVVLPSDDPATPPSGDWAEQTEGPVAAAVNDCLPDGLRVRAIYPEDHLADLETDPACTVLPDPAPLDVSRPGLIAFDVTPVVSK